MRKNFVSNKQHHHVVLPYNFLNFSDKINESKSNLDSDTTNLFSNIFNDLYSVKVSFDRPLESELSKLLYLFHQLQICSYKEFSISKRMLYNRNNNFVDRDDNAINCIILFKNIRKFGSKTCLPLRFKGNKRKLLTTYELRRYSGNWI